MCVAAHRCYVCNDCESSSGASEDCGNVEDKVNMLFQSMGISADSSEIEPSNSCYMMLMDGLGEPKKHRKMIW